MQVFSFALSSTSTQHVSPRSHMRYRSKSTSNCHSLNARQIPKHCMKSWKTSRKAGIISCYAIISRKHGECATRRPNTMKTFTFHITTTVPPQLKTRRRRTQETYKNNARWSIYTKKSSVGTKSYYIWPACTTASSHGRASHKYKRKENGWLSNASPCSPQTPTLNPSH